MVLRQVNLPEEGITLVIGVDRLLDMARTVVNVTGDAVVSCFVAKSEGQLDGLQASSRFTQRSLVLSTVLLNSVTLVLSRELREV